MQISLSPCYQSEINESCSVEVWKDGQELISIEANNSGFISRVQRNVFRENPGPTVSNVSGAY